jgi:hypothetical protein
MQNPATSPPAPPFFGWEPFQVSPGLALEDLGGHVRLHIPEGQEDLSPLSAARLAMLLQAWSDQRRGRGRYRRRG